MSRPRGKVWARDQHWGWFDVSMCTAPGIDEASKKEEERKEKRHIPALGDCQKFGFGQETGSPGSGRIQLMTTV